MPNVLYRPIVFARERAQRDVNLCCLLDANYILSHFHNTYLNFKLYPGIWLIAAGYPVPKRGNSANH